MIKLVKKVVAYYRNSTDLQEHSINTQKSMALSYCSKHKIILDEEFEDVDTSARKLRMEQRSGLNKIIKLIEQGLVKGLIVYKRDRLARNVEEHMTLYEKFKSHNVKVYFTSENEVPMHYSPVGEYLETILGAMAEHEGKQIALRIKETRIANFIEGNTFGNYPFGYKKDEITNEIIIDDDKAKIVRAVFNTVLNGNHDNLSSIYKHLKKIGIRKTSSKDGSLIDWNKESLRSIIQNMMYAGTRILNFGNTPYQKKYEKLLIVNENDWYEANRIFDELLANNGTRNKFRYPLKNLLYCKKCKNKLVFKTLMRKGIKYRIAKCENTTTCTTIAFLDEITKIVDVQSEFYFENLLSKHFNELYERQQSNNIEKIKMQINKIKEAITHQEKVVIKKTEVFVRKRTQSSKDDLVKEYELLTKMKKQVGYYFDQRDEINGFLERVKELNENKEAILSQVDEDAKEIYYKDLIDSIEIGNYEIDIHFKHPFFSSKEMYIHEKSDEFI